MTTFTIKVPENIATRINEQALFHGTTAEEFIESEINKILPLKPGERLKQLCGTAVYPEQNVAERIDEIIGDGLIDELRGQDGR